MQHEEISAFSPFHHIPAAAWTTTITPYCPPPYIVGTLSYIHLKYLTLFALGQFLRTHGWGGGGDISIPL